MQPKRIITLLLVVVLTFICGVTSVAAQDNAAETLDIAVEATSSTAVVSEPVSVNAGATVDVSVAIKANPGVTVVNLALNYDAKALTPKTDADGNLEVKLNKLFAVESILDFDAEKGVITYLGGAVDWTQAENVTATGALFTLTFTVNKDFHGEAALTLSEYETGIINNKYQVLSANVSDGNTEGYNKATVSTHKWGTPAVVKADCITDGTTTHTCTDTTCNKAVVILDQAALGHDLTDPATCTTAQTCKREGCVHVEQEATNHKDSIVIDAGKDATCTATGLTQGSHCSACNAVIVAQEEIAVKDHDYSDWTVEKEATKKEQGLKSKTCTVCGDKVTEVTPVLPSSNTGLIVLIIVLAVVVLGAGGFCLYWFVFRKKKTA